MLIFFIREHVEIGHLVATGMPREVAIAIVDRYEKEVQELLPFHCSFSAVWLINSTESNDEPFAELAKFGVDQKLREEAWGRAVSSAA